MSEHINTYVILTVKLDESVFQEAYIVSNEFKKFADELVGKFNIKEVAVYVENGSMRVFDE